MEPVKYNFENLEVYNLGKKLIIEIYRLSSNFPKEEMYGLTSQIRRACVSVVLNIAEGTSRKSKKEFSIFIDRSIGSLIETKACLNITQDLEYINEDKLKELLPKIDELYFKLLKFKKYLDNK